MANFGERIAYWYLRLQGFLLAENFVMHSGGQIGRTADTDLLAVRNKYSEELISGKRLLRDEWLESLLAASDRNVALIVQVKTGQDSEAGPAFNCARLAYAIRFLGISSRSEELARQLKHESSIECGSDWTIAKLLVARNPEDKNALNVSLRQAEAFICQRLRAHRERKLADRMFFHDELMQFLAWSASSDP